MTRRGYTLIEVMIVVAVLGITAAGASLTGSRIRMHGIDALQQEQAWLLLEYRATCLSGGRVPDATVEDRLTAPLPDAVVTSTSSGAHTTVGIASTDPFGRATHRDLTVFARRSAP